MKSNFIISGGIAGFIAIIVYIINSVVYSNNQALVNIIDKNVADCYNKESFDKKRDGDLVFYSDFYNGEKAIDKDFGTEFKGSIIYSFVEELRREQVRKNDGWESI